MFTQSHRLNIHSALLTTQRCASPLQDDSSRSALAGVGLQCVTQTLVRVGPTSTEVIPAGPEPRFRRNHVMAGLENGRLQYLAAGDGTFLGLESSTVTGINIHSRTTGVVSLASVQDLK